jgi:hypothetical protein
MFDINIAVHKQEQLKRDAIHGLPGQEIDYQESIQHVNGDAYEQQAEREGEAMSRAYRSRTHIVLRRTYKVDGDTFPTGQKHRAICRNW